MDINAYDRMKKAFSLTARDAENNDPIAEATLRLLAVAYEMGWREAKMAADVEALRRALAADGRDC